jgi:sec-independent protein translocase protein TatA
VIENLFRPTHLLLVLAIALLVFGPKNLPQIGRGLGEAIRGFKAAITEGDQDDASKPPAPDGRKT